MEDNEFVIEEPEEPAPAAEADEGDGEGDEGDGESAGGAGTEAGDAKPTQQAPRKRADVRRDRAIEHRALTEERERRLAAERRSDELAAQLARGITDATGKLSDAAARMGPQEKPLAERVRERVLKATKSIREDDPATVEHFLQEQLEAAKELGADEARRIVKEEMGKFRQEQPRPVDPAALRLQARFEWLFSDEHWGGVQAIRQQIANKEGRNLRDPAVLEKTTAEAAARWAGMNGLKIAGGETRDAAAGARSRAAGTGGRNGGGAGPAAAAATGAAYVKARPWSRGQADRVFPNLKGDARYKAFYDEYVKPELERANK